MPKRGRAGSDRSRIALLHALAHIEFVAIDLAWDLVGRFGGEMPRRFTDDWVTVAAEESMHFALLDRRLRALASLPTDHLFTDLGARLARGPLRWRMTITVAAPGDITNKDRKSTRLNSVTNAQLVCRLLLEK